jgi:putative addiction module component (TIGR02574 family)
VPGKVRACDERRKECRAENIWLEQFKSDLQTVRLSVKPLFPSEGASALAQQALFQFIGGMTLRVLEKELMELPPRSRVRLAERIIESIGDYADPQLEAAWNVEIERRVQGIESGAEKGVPAEQVMKEARRALNETRRVPSARRK